MPEPHEEWSGSRGHKTMESANPSQSSETNLDLIWKSMNSYLWTVNQTNPEKLAELQAATGLTRAIALTLANRRLTTDTIDDFLRPALKKLLDPYLLSGTETAAARLWQAVRTKEQILIHGDYDVDGLTAAELLYQVLTRNGGKAEIFLPHRIEDGYGLTIESIKKAGSTPFSLLVTVDCGINSTETVAAARRQGIEVIITDHHQPGPELPDAKAVINPKLKNTPSECTDLAGVGVAFKLAHAFLKYGREHNLGGFATDLKDYLDLVALGTVADIVPLRGENRRLVKHGLPILSRKRRPGIQALCECAGMDGENINTLDIAFRLAPRLNAAGRMGDAGLSLSLLAATSMSESGPLARSVNIANQQRQEKEGQVLIQAEEQLRESGFTPADAAIIVHHKDWHPGVLGIVAARLIRSYHRPTIVLSQESSTLYSGSARSIPDLDMVKTLSSVSHLLESYGGHAMAAGLTVQEKNLHAFKKEFAAAVASSLTPESYHPQIQAEGEVELDDFNDRFFAEREYLEPFGCGNPEPMFICRGLVPQWTVKAGQNHTRGAILGENGRMIDFIAFRRTPEELPRPPWDLAVKPQLNTYRGLCKPQVEIVDLRSSAC